MLTHARDSAETAFCHVIPIATLLLFLPMLSVTSAAVFLWSPTPAHQCGSDGQSN